MDSIRTEARFYDTAEWESVSCKLCPHNCAIAPSRTGTCGVRSNKDGKLYVDLYGKVASREVLNSDDLPLYHFRPEMSWLRIGSRGCTMRCPFCNTYRFSQTGGVRTTPATPDELVSMATSGGIHGISFGVSEPAPIHEYVMDVFIPARAAGLETHVATSGMWSPHALRELAPHLRAVTFGLKGFHEEYYTQQFGGNLKTVLANIDMLHAIGVHTEISWLVIPGYTDQAYQVEGLLHFLEARQMAPPIILLPYEPEFMWNQKEGPPPAVLSHLQAARQLFQTYWGAVYEHHPESPEQNTRCVNCHRTLVRRGVARLVVTSFPTGKPKNVCPNCNTAVPYVTA